MRPRVVFVVAFLGASVVAGCGASRPPRPASTEAVPASGLGAATAAPRMPTPSPPAPSSPTMESQREPFMRSCLEKAGSRPYCDCGFDEFRRIFRDADLSRPVPSDDPRLAELNESTVAACGGRLTEADVHANFVEGCVGRIEDKRRYCECAWTQLRERLSIAEFLGSSVSGPKLEQLRRPMAAACKGTLPAAVVRTDFMQSCSKGDGARGAARCSCMWKKIVARYGAEEIEGGLVDRGSVPGLADCL